MINAIFTIKIQHDEDTLIALSHMRYDLFSTGNRIARDLLSALLIVVAVLYGNASLWSFLLIIMAGSFGVTDVLKVYHKIELV